MTETIPDLLAEISKLKAEVELLRKKKDFACPKCGGGLRNTKYGRFLCRQEYGLCGELRFGVKKRSPYSFMRFTRTEIEKDGSTYSIWKDKEDKNLRVNKFFVGDKEVSKDDYFNPGSHSASPTPG